MCVKRHTVYEKQLLTKGTCTSADLDAIKTTVNTTTESEFTTAKESGTHSQMSGAASCPQEVHRQYEKIFITISKGAGIDWETVEALAFGSSLSWSPITPEHAALVNGETHSSAIVALSKTNKAPDVQACIPSPRSTDSPRSLMRTNSIIRSEFDMLDFEMETHFNGAQGYIPDCLCQPISRLIKRAQRAARQAANHGGAVHHHEEFKTEDEAHIESDTLQRHVAATPSRPPVQYVDAKTGLVVNPHAGRFVVLPKHHQQQMQMSAQFIAHPSTQQQFTFAPSCRHSSISTRLSANPPPVRPSEHLSCRLKRFLQQVEEDRDIVPPMSESVRIRQLHRDLDRYGRSQEYLLREKVHIFPEVGESMV
eukprot:gene41177-50971_t